MTANNTYTIEIREYANSWYAKFAYTASNEIEAASKMRVWMRYQGMTRDDVRFRAATTSEAANMLHNEYVK